MNSVYETFYHYLNFNWLQYEYSNIQKKHIENAVERLKFVQIVESDYLEFEVLQRRRPINREWKMSVVWLP